MTALWTRSLLGCTLAATLALPAAAAGLGDMLRQEASGALGGSSNSGASSSGSTGLGGLGGMLGGSSASGGSAGALAALGLGSPATAGNAAGVLTYCMKNNYLNANKAAQVKDQLLGKLGMGRQQEPQDTGYQSGLSGLIQGSGGQSFSLDKVKGNLKEKACDFVLDHAQSFL